MVSTNKDINFPDIPEKRYFTIGETAKLCLVEPHVLRYWEQEFTQLAPVTRRGNRRYYQHKDVHLIRNIYSLLYQQGFTIQGAKKQLSNRNTVIAKQIMKQEQYEHIENAIDVLGQIADWLEPQKDANKNH